MVVGDQGVFPEGNPFCMIRVTRRCLRSLAIWKDPWFLSQGPMLGVSCCRKILSIDASLTGWGAVMRGRFARGLWGPQHCSWHINCLEMLAVYKALRSFLPDLHGHNVLIPSNDMSVVSYLNHQGGLRSRPLCKLAHQILLWSQGKLSSLRAMYVPGDQNQEADVLLMQWLRPGEWRLHPEVVEAMCERFCPVEVDLFASRETTHCPLWFSLRHPAPLGLDAMTLRISPDCSAPGSSGAGPPGGHQPSLSSTPGADLSLVLRYRGTLRRPSMAGPSEGRSAVSGWGHNLSPQARVVGPLGLALEVAQYLEDGLSATVVETILSFRSPSTRRLYSLRWNVFSTWCREREVDPVNCAAAAVLEFLQDRFSAGLTPSTLKVYVAAIGAFHSPIDAGPLGRHHSIVRFLRGVQRLRPAAHFRVPAWDLAVVLEMLAEAPFEPLESAEARNLTRGVAFSSPSLLKGE